MTPTGPPQSPPGWYPSPFEAGAYAWFDGWYWHHPTAETNGVDAAENKRFFPRIPTLSIGAAWLGIAAVAFIMATNLLTNIDNTVLVAIVGLLALAVSTLGHPLLAFGSSFWFGTRKPVRDLGLRFRLDDLWIGPVGGFALMVIAIATSLLAVGIGLPEGSNLDDLEEMGQNGAVFALMFVLAGIVAPITEELIFRGLIQRGLSSKISPVAALFIQGVIFGSAHFLLNLGWGNVGLIFSLTCLGFGLGFIAHFTGRLIPGMLAHAAFNCTQLTLLWFSLGHVG